MTTPTDHHHHPPDRSLAEQAEDVSRLQSTFLTKPFQDHPLIWDSLWNDEYTPWDRGGPSLALSDLLTQHPEYFPQLSSPSSAGDDRPKALVPGCGKGHDVLLLSSLGYDTYGLDFSEKAIVEAKENEKAENERGEGRVERGKITWIAGDFFVKGVLEKKTGVDRFDLIFDYTFFCALPIDGRPKWAERVASLLNSSSGRLVCLEWPLHKPPKTGGPPWGVTEQVYLAHLSHPGELLPYDGECNLIVDSKTLLKPDGTKALGLQRIARVRPSRTHKSGYDPDGNLIDSISIWGFRDSK